MPQAKTPQPKSDFPDIDYDSLVGAIASPKDAPSYKGTSFPDIDYDSLIAPAPEPAAPAPAPQPAAPAAPGFLDRAASAAAAYLNPPPPLPAPMPPPAPSDPTGAIARQNGNLDLPKPAAAPPVGPQQPPPFARATQQPAAPVPPQMQMPSPEVASRGQMTHAPGAQPPEPPQGPSGLEAAQEPISKKIPLIGMSLSELVDKLLPEQQAQPGAPTPGAGPQGLAKDSGVNTPTLPPTGVYDAARRTAKMAAGLADFAQSPEGLAVLAAEAFTAGGATPVIAPLLMGQFEGQSAAQAKKALEDMRKNGFTPENTEQFLQAITIAEGAFMGPAAMREMHMRTAELVQNKQWLADANAALDRAWQEKSAREAQSSADKFNNKVNPPMNREQRRGTLEVPKTTIPEDNTQHFSDAELEQMTKPEAKPATEQTAPEKSQFGIPDIDYDSLIKEEPATEAAKTEPEVKPNAEPEKVIPTEKPAISETQPKPDEALSKRVADFYDQVQSNPNDPVVKKAYDALNNETSEQYDYLVKKGYTFTFTDNPETYASSADLIKDVKENKHLNVWTGEPPAHGLISQEQNNKFRAVHDVYGHGEPEATFGHAGEEKAYKSHYDMYSEDARPALATETRGQNSALHFSEKLGNNPKDIYKDSTKVDLKFPEQKAIAMPHELRKTKAEESEGLGLASNESGHAANWSEAPGGEETIDRGRDPAFEARTTPRGSTVWMSEEGLSALKRATNQKAAAGLTIGHDDGNLVLDRMKKNMSIDPRITNEFRAAIRQVSKDQGLKPIAFVPRPGVRPFSMVKEIARHEGNHVQLIDDAGYDLGSLMKRLTKDPATMDIASRALTRLQERGYPLEHTPLELVAHLAGGQTHYLDLEPEEATQLMGAIADDMEKQFGTEKALTILSKSHPMMKEVIDGVLKSPREVGAESGAVSGDQEEGRARSSGEVVQGRGDTELGLASKEIGKREIKQVGLKSEKVVPRAEDFADELLKKGRLQNIIAAAERGSVAKYWYQNSKNAFDKYFGDDAPLMAKLTAALSTASDPKQNLMSALETYNKWKAAGRPTDVAKVEPILDSVSRIGGKDYPARYNNARTVLTGADDVKSIDLSGMKVRSFWRNLAGQYDFATLDRHMATLAGVRQSVFGNAEGYLGSQAIWKKAAAEKGWPTASIQSSSWTWTKPFTEMVQKGVPAAEAMHAVKDLDKDDVNDFAKLVNTDPEIRAALDDHFKQQGTTLADFEAEHGQAQIKYGRKEGTLTPFTENFASEAEAKIKQDQAEKKAARQAKKVRQEEAAGQGKLGFASKDDTILTSPLQKLVANGARPIQAKDLNKSGFITEDGRTLQLNGDHGEALEKAGILADGRNINSPKDAPELAESGLLRVHVVKGFAPEIALSSYKSPTRLQMSSLRNMAEANPRATFSYDFYDKDGKYLAGKGNASYSDFAKAANKTYDLGLEPRMLASKGEEGILRLFGKDPNKPEISTNSTEYQKIEDGQNKAQVPSKVDLLAALNEKTRKLGREFLDRWIDVKEDVVDDAVKRGVQIPKGENPLHALQLEYGGGMGRVEAAHWDMSDVKRDATKAGLYGETTKYLNLVGNRRAIEVVQEKLAAATARGDTAAVTRYTDRLAQAKVAAAGFDMPALTRDLQDQEKQLGPAKFKQVQDFGKAFFKIPREALDMAHAEGIVSDEMYKKFTSRGDEYVHMGRILDDVDEGRAGFGTAMSLRKQHGVKALEGSELINKDPWATTMDNTALMYREIARNRAARSLVNFKDIDPQGWGQLVKEVKGPVTTAGKDNGTIAYYEDGKPRTFAVPQVIADAVSNANSAEVKMLGSALLGKTASLFRAGATGLNAAYALTSPIREFIDTGTMTWKSPKDAVDFTKNLFSSLGHIVAKDQTYRDFLRGGGSYSSLQSRIDPYVNLHGNDSLVAKMMHPLQTVGQMNDALQTMSKMAAQKTFMDKGMNPTEAAAEARVYAGRPDVANAGTRTADMNKLLMFFVDKLKGAERSYMFMKSHPKQFLAMSGALALGELALNRYNAQFDSPENDGSKEWDKISENDKRANYNILTPYSYQAANGEKRLLSFKIPRGRFAAGGVARDIWQGVFDQITPKQTALNLLTDVLPGDYRLRVGDSAGKDMARATAQTLNPAIKEGIEQYANEDMYSGRPIVSKSMEDLEGPYQYNEATSPTAIKLGKALNASPQRIEHAIRGFGAGVADMVVSGLDKLQKDRRAPAEGPEKASRLPVIGPIIRRFVGSSTDQVQSDDEQKFYDMRDKSQRATKTLDAAFKRAADRKDVIKEFTSQPEKAVLAELSPTLTEYSTQMSAMREMMNRVARAGARSDLGDLYPSWEKDPGKLDDTQKKGIIRGIHASYKELLTQTKEVQKAIDAAGKLPKEYTAKMIADVLNRSSMTPEPIPADEEEQ